MRQLVAFVSETAHIGGSEVNLATTARYMGRTAWQPLVVLPEQGALAELLAASDIPVYQIPHPSFISTSFYIRQRFKLPNPLVWIARLYGFLRRRKPAVVHTINLWSHIFAGVAARLAGRPVVWHLQDIVSPGSGFGLYRLLLLLGARYIPNHILCPSPRVASQFSQWTGYEHKLGLLGNIIDVNKFAPAKQKAPVVTSSSLKIGTSARLTPWKGQETALRAARLLKQQSVDFIWYFAGDEGLGSKGYGQYLRDLTQAWGLEDMPAFYRSLDVLVHPSVEPDPFPVTIGEALASGLPVILSSGGGADHLVEAAGGILVPPKAPEAIAEALVQLVETPETMTRMSKNARIFAERNFDIDSYVETLATLYQSLAGQS
jgi:glycosyltransferase involved in cell wall biosynthesis